MRRGINQHTLDKDLRARTREGDKASEVLENIGGIRSNLGTRTSRYSYKKVNSAGDGQSDPKLYPLPFHDAVADRGSALQVPFRSDE